MIRKDCADRPEGEHVNQDGQHDETGRPSGKVLHPDPRSDLEVAEEGPELTDRRQTDGSDGEEADPFAACDGAETESTRDEPLPPGSGEWPRLIFVGEADEREHCSSGEEDQGRIEQDEPGLGDERVLKRDEHGTEDGGSDGT